MILIESLRGNAATSLSVVEDEYNPLVRGVAGVRVPGVGGSIGAGAGAVIGAVAGGRRNRVKGAVVGAVVGGVLGGVIGNNVDKSTRVVYDFR